MRPVRVLKIVNSVAIGGSMGGAERLAVSLARAFDRTLVQPTIVALWDLDPDLSATWQARLTAEGIPTFVRPQLTQAQFAQNFNGVLRFLAEVAPSPVDVLHSHADFGDMVALFLRRRLGAKAVIRTAHNEREWPNHPLRRWLLLNGTYLYTFDRELGVSQRVVDILDRRPLARLFRRRALLAYNAIDLNRFARTVSFDAQRKRTTLGLPSAARVVGSIGRLSAQKGYRCLVQAAAAVVARQPDVHFVIVGAGEEAETLQQQAIAAGIAGHIHLLGAREDVEELFACMELFVSSSLWEGLPTVLLEAMAAGVPVIATRVSGTIELVENGITGVLVAPGDPQQLATAILAALVQPASGQAMAARAREFVFARFDIAAVARQHEAIYQELAPPQ